MNLSEFEEIRKAMERPHAPRWKLDDDFEWMFEPKPKSELRSLYAIDCKNVVEYERTKAMIEFCTKYENELFETFYKWFKKERKVN